MHRFHAPPSPSFSDSSQSTLYLSLINNSTGSPGSIFRDQNVLITMSPKSLNPDAKPFFHFPSNMFCKPLDPYAKPFHIQTYICNSSGQFRPLIPAKHNRVTMERPRVTRFFCPDSSRKHHVVSRPSVHVGKPKSDKLLEKKMKSKGNIIPFPLCSSDQKPSCTTVMIKNIPNQFRRTNLVAILRSHCKEENKRSECKSEFDFVYLPMDFQQYWENNRVANLGYAFVNFTSYLGALRFYQYYDNREWKVKLNNKICEVTCAKIQGKEALVRQFKNSAFWCHTDMYLPAVLEPACDGESQHKLINVGVRVCAPSRQRRTK